MKPLRRDKVSNKEINYLKIDVLVSGKDKLSRCMNFEHMQVSDKALIDSSEIDLSNFFWFKQK